MGRINNSVLKLKFNNIHGDKYDYSKVNYVNAKTKVCIICPEHGEFWQRHSNHLNGEGCYMCGKVKRANECKKSAFNRRSWDFEQHEEYKLIPVSRGEYTKVSNEDFERVKGINWSLSSIRYVKNTRHGLLSRFILKPTSNIEVDHINGDTLDNRRENLRFASRAQNVYNTKAQYNSSSLHKGVSYSKIRKKWVAQITLNGNHYFLGRYNTELEASKAYNEKAKELHGEFAKLNKLDTQ